MDFIHMSLVFPWVSFSVPGSNWGYHIVLSLSSILFRRSFITLSKCGSKGKIYVRTASVFHNHLKVNQHLLSFYYVPGTILRVYMYNLIFFPLQNPCEVGTIIISILWIGKLRWGHHDTQRLRAVTATQTVRLSSYTQMWCLRISCREAEELLGSLVFLSCCSGR